MTDEVPTTDPQPAEAETPEAHAEAAASATAVADEGAAPEPTTAPAASKNPPPSEPPAPPAAEEPDSAPPPSPSNKRWYVVKVQSGREESIKESIERRVKIEGLEEYFGQIIIPVEKVTEMRGGKRTVRERKLFPGYLMVEVEYNEQIP